MRKKVKIVVENVGVNFGCCGYVMAGREVLHSTRVFPLGMRSNAYEAAESWARTHLDGPT
jgi:hypothetical protein